MANTVVGKSDDPKLGMTLGEVAAWVQQAKELGVPVDTPVKVETGWRSQIKELST